MRTSVAVLLCLSATCLTARAEWSFTRQVYSCTTSGMTLQELASAGVTYVSHVDAARETADDAHRWGLKTMPYVSLYKVIDTSLDPSYAKEPFWKEIDLVQHPDWALIRQDGQRRLPFDDPNYPRGIFQSCCNQPGIADAYVKGVEQVIATGADGVFVDNVHPYPKCYGPDLGLHQHLDPTKDNTAMYKIALRRVYDAVKAHGPEFAVMLNSGGPSHDYIGYGDTLMWESWVFRWPEQSMRGDLVQACRMQDWKAVLKAYEDWKDYTSAGGSIAPLTYLPVRELEKPHAYLSYVCAKLCGFEQWTGEGAERQDIIRQLYRTDLGMPVGPLESAGSVYYRRYEHGLVAGNSATGMSPATLPWALEQAGVADVYSGELLTAREGELQVELPPDCGRVYVTRDAYLANCLGEAAGMAQSCALHLEQQASDSPEAKARHEACLAALKEAAACLQAVRRNGLPGDVAARQRIANLPRLLDRASQETEAQPSVEGRLLKGEPAKAEDLPTLLTVKGKTPFAAQVSDEGVRLSAGGVGFAFRNEADSASFRLGDTGMTLWVGPASLQERHGWLFARRLQDMQLVKDTPAEKTVQFAVQLYGSKSKQDIGDFDVLVKATIRPGLPAVILETALRNHTDKPVPAYWFWNVAGRFHTSSNGTTAEPKEWGTVASAAWYYVHGQADGGGGVLLTGWTGLGYGGGQADVFADPRNQSLPAGGEMPIRFTAYAVAGPARRDDFLRQRLQWYEQYASLAAEVVTGVHVRLQASPSGVAGTSASVSLVLSGAEAQRLTEPRFGLAATAGARELVVHATADHPAEFAVELPGDLREGQRIDLKGTLAAKSGGRTVALTSFEALRVKPALEVVEVHQVPAQGEGLAFGVVLRNNLVQPLSVSVKLTAEGLPELPTTTATLVPDPKGKLVTISVPGAALSAGNAKTKTRLTATYELQPGGPLTVSDEREVALTPQALCQTAANPPVIDGKLDDSGWNFATKLTGFVDHQTGQPARETTVCYVMNDDDALYVGFVCSQADMQHLRAEAKPDPNGLNPDAPSDDSVEVYVDPRTEGVPYFRLCLNSLRAAKASVPGGWATAVTSEADRWIVELKLPFKVIGATPRPGDVWGFNVCRNNQAVPEAASWSWTQGAYANPQRFGGLKFVSAGH